MPTAKADQSRARQRLMAKMKRLIHKAEPLQRCNKILSSGGDPTPAERAELRKLTRPFTRRGR
jgi:hypothetical protein